jgi:hypothetical protein
MDVPPSLPDHLAGLLLAGGKLYAEALASSEWPAQRVCLDLRRAEWIAFPSGPRAVVFVVISTHPVGRRLFTRMVQPATVMAVVSGALLCSDGSRVEVSEGWVQALALSRLQGVTHEDACCA